MSQPIDHHAIAEALLLRFSRHTTNDQQSNDDQVSEAERFASQRSNDDDHDDNDHRDSVRGFRLGSDKPDDG